jgi:hypothetical protein
VGSLFFCVCRGTETSCLVEVVLWWRDAGDGAYQDIEIPEGGKPRARVCCIASSAVTLIISRTGRCTYLLVLIKQTRWSTVFLSDFRKRHLAGGPYLRRLFRKVIEKVHRSPPTRFRLRIPPALSIYCHWLYTSVSCRMISILCNIWDIAWLEMRGSQCAQWMDIHLKKPNPNPIQSIKVLIQIQSINPLDIHWIIS